MFSALLAVLALIAPGSGDRPLDRVVLKDGTKLEGRVVLDAQNRVVIRIGTRDREIDRGDVRSVDSRLASWHEA